MHPHVADLHHLPIRGEERARAPVLLGHLIDLKYSNRSAASKYGGEPGRHMTGLGGGEQGVISMCI